MGREEDSEAMPDLGFLAGIASALAILGSGLRVGLTVKKHNRLALEEYEDRARWIRDDLRREARALDTAEDDMRARGIGGGLAGQAEARVRREYAERWRNRKSEGERKIQALRDAEHIAHRLWRRVPGRGWPENPHAEEVARLSRGWEEIIRAEGM